MMYRKRRDSLIYKFIWMFLLMIILVLIINGFGTYMLQMNAFRLQSEENINNVASYLEQIMEHGGEEFISYQEFFILHHEEMRIPYDFNGDWLPEQRKFERLLAENHPNQVLGEDLSFADLTEEEQTAYAVYQYEYWLALFEDARKIFGVPYTYYMIPTINDDGEEDMYYVVDGMRMKQEINGEEYIELGHEAEATRKGHPKIWEAYDGGVRPSGYEVFDNEYGQTYAYYTPLIINGKKLGIIGADVEIAKINDAILRSTLRLVLFTSVILCVFIFLLLLVIRDRYIKKLLLLEGRIHTYAQNKDPEMAVLIEQEISGRDEIASLSKEMANLILELESYMKNLLKTTQELSVTRKQADAMQELANKDALTGIRNKTAYDKEMQRLEWERKSGDKEFGIAMVDLNFLKRINDTFGHECGNIAIKKLCSLVCHVFDHSPVFRIGGDEFVVVLENGDYENRDELIGIFNEKLEMMAGDQSLEAWEKISAAIGVAIYDPEIDDSVTNVFKRADKAMYQRKKDMKAVREN